MTDGLNAHLVVKRAEGFVLDIELLIEPGVTVALLGPNGAGKTTAVTTLAGLTPLDAGRIEIDGIPLDDPARSVFEPPERRDVGVVFQDYLLFPHLSVADNIGFGLASRRLPRSDIVSRVGHWIDALDLGELSHARPDQLSGGEAQRVALARALVTEPSLLLLDEPLAALDVTTRTQLRRILRSHLERFEGPKLLITHEPTEAFLLADQIYVIEDGAITQIGTPADIRLRPRTAYAADLAGANLLEGFAADGSVMVGDHALVVADQHTQGPVLATIHPRAIALYPEPPQGSPRNTWQTSVALVEDLGERVRVQLGAPLPLTAEITPGSVTSLGLGAGVEIWVSVKATEISVAAV